MRNDTEIRAELARLHEQLWGSVGLEVTGNTTETLARIDQLNWVLAGEAPKTEEVAVAAHPRVEDSTDPLTEVRIEALYTAQDDADNPAGAQGLWGSVREGFSRFVGGALASELTESPIEAPEPANTELIRLPQHSSRR